MADKRIPSSGFEKKGGYSGGKPASQMRPPMKVPSGVTSSPKKDTSPKK